MTPSIDRLVEDHEERIRNLEKITTETKYTMLNLEKQTVELKATVLEGNKKHSEEIQRFTDQMIALVETLIHSKLEEDKREAETEQKKKLVDRKEVWGVAGLIIAGTIQIITKMFFG